MFLDFGATAELSESMRRGILDFVQGVFINDVDKIQETVSRSLADFARQLQYLKDNGYHVLSADELYAFVQNRQALPPRSVLITIDDGFRSVYDIAYPILREHGFTRVHLAGLATDFCVAWSAVDARRYGFEALVIADACRAIDTAGSLAAASAAAVSSEAATYTHRLTRSTFAPRYWAGSSPSVSRSSERPARASR